MSSDERRYKNFLFYVTNFISDFLQKCKVFHYRELMRRIPGCYTDDFAGEKSKKLENFLAKPVAVVIRIARG